MIDRIKKVIEKEGNNPSAFAELIGISRSSMNHILNGRNNPSLDVLMKILGKFEDLNSDWLLFGKSPMYKGEKAFLQPSLFDENPVEQNKVPEKIEYRKEIEVKVPEKEVKTIYNEPVIPSVQVTRKISQIIIFYSDGTFETLDNNK